MAEITTCARHPKVETGLRCTQCETPICPSCATDAVVGMRCPTCAKPPKDGGMRRRPDQVRNAALMAGLAAVIGGAVFGAYVVYVGFFTIVVAYFLGLTIGQRVREAASGNTVDVVRVLGFASAIGAVLLGELVMVGLLGYQVRLGGYQLFELAGVAFGAYRAME